MSFGSQTGSQSGIQTSEGRSLGESAAKSTFGGESSNTSRGSSLGESLGLSTSGGTGQGTSFGFSGLSPIDADILSGSIRNAITGEVIPTLTSTAGANITLPTLDATGLFPAQRRAAEQAVRDAVIGISSERARAGFLSPDNVSGIAGSAVQNVLPQLFPTISQNVLASARAPIDAALGRSQAIAQLLSGIPGLLGSRQSSENLSNQFARSLQSARSESEQFADATSRNFGESISRSLQEAFSQSMGQQLGRSFGFGLGLR